MDSSHHDDDSSHEGGAEVRCLLKEMMLARQPLL